MAGTFNPDILVFNTTGYSPHRWWEELNVMFEKTPGNFNVEKLRIILLFEADFNSNNKWLGHAVMFNAEDHHQMALEQYGSHEEKSAVIQFLNKQLLYDYMCYTHIITMAVCSNDAKSCYNSIVLIVAVLCLCHLGANKAAVQVC